MLRKFLVPHRNLNFLSISNRLGKLHYVRTKKNAVKLTSRHGAENGVIMPDSWVRKVCVGNMWLRELEKHHSPCVWENLKLLVSLDLRVLVVKM